MIDFYTESLDSDSPTWRMPCPFSFFSTEYLRAHTMDPQIFTRLNKILAEITIRPNGITSEERQKPQPSPLLKKYRNTPPICIGILFVPRYTLMKGNTASTPPICIAVCPPFVLQYASHLYRSTFGKILVVVVTGMFPITDRETYFRDIYGFHSRCRYRRKSCWNYFFVADADTAVLCSLKGTA